MPLCSNAFSMCRYYVLLVNWMPKGWCASSEWHETQFSPITSWAEQAVGGEIEWKTQAECGKKIHTQTHTRNEHFRASVQHQWNSKSALKIKVNASGWKLEGTLLDKHIIILSFQFFCRRRIHFFCFYCCCCTHPAHCWRLCLWAVARRFCAIHVRHRRMESAGHSCASQREKHKYTHREWMG